MIPFISPDDLEALLGESLVNPTALIVAISLDSACTAIRTYLGQTINLVEDDVEVRSGSGRRKIRLRQRPVREVSEVKIDDEIQDPASYNVRGAVITFTDGSFWWNGNDNTYITYTHGWDVEEPTDFPVPADIRMVALLIARRVYEAVGYEQGSAGGAIISETIGDYSYTLSESSLATVTSASELTSGEKSSIASYRVELVGDTPTQ